MFEVFSSYLKDKAAFTEEDLQQVKKVCSYRSLAANEKLITEGDLWGHNAFVCSGLTRGYRTGLDGKPITINFSPEHYWTGDREGLLTGKPSTVNVEALVPTQLVLITKDDFDRLCVNLTPFSEFMTTLIQRNLSAYQTRMAETLNFNDEEKFAAFIAKFPTVLQRAPLNTIATYLDMECKVLSYLINRLL
ncbi:Crp/Fnr family transcriptional regulator [Flavobacterium psychrotrophum]|uniref:Crp/Fnr family transcriptional regulator n=1 Tax=Flavobacterium psychrotrophum TaxID=2294119 RepID=UPI000E32456A|nr:Crp/Fnr family transcriptional regulator [Flavobacterium psychrotrophum]